MEWLIALSSIIVLIVITFVFLFFMPKPVVFFTPDQYIMNVLQSNKEIIESETKKANKQVNSVIPIYGLNKIHSYDYPEIYNILLSIPYLKTAGILNLKPEFQSNRIYGFNEVANNSIRYFYTIEESACYKSGIWIDGEKKFFIRNECICGDMSREHALFNNDKLSYTTVLFIDIDRPEEIHKGNSPNTDITKDEIINLFST